MNKAVSLGLIILALITGFVGGVFQNKGAGDTSGKLKLGNEMIGNAVITHVTIEGKVTAIDGKTMTIEKDGNRLVVLMSDDSSFSKIQTSSEVQATPSATISLKEIPVGSEIIGGGVIKQDLGTKEYKLYTSNFYVK